MKKTICVLLAVLLCALAACPALAEETEEYTELERIFIPSVITDLVNAHMLRLSEHWGDQHGSTVEDVDSLKAALALTFTESQDYLMFYDNPDWSVEMTFAWPEGTEPDPDRPARTFSLAVKGTMEESVRKMMEAALVLAIADLAVDIDPVAVADFIDAGKFEGEEFPLFGDFALCLARLPDGYYHYAILDKTYHVEVPEE